MDSLLGTLRVELERRADREELKANERRRLGEVASRYDGAAAAYRKCLRLIANLESHGTLNNG